MPKRSDQHRPPGWRPYSQTKKEQDKQRGTAHERGYTYQWHKASKAFLREHPLCKPCLDRDVVTPAYATDHIVPHRGDQTLFWDKANWQPICKTCHAIKTAKEDGGFGNPRGA